MPRKGKHHVGFEDEYDDYYDDDDYDYEQQEFAISSRSYDHQEAASFAPAYDGKERSLQGDGPSNQGCNFWRCSVCTFDNPEDLGLCDVCGVIRNSFSIEPSSPSEDSANRVSKLSGSSMLARSLFAPLPEAKVKKTRVYQEMKDKLLSQESGKMYGDFQELQKLLLSASQRRNPEIVAFKFESPSPDDIVAAGRQSGIRTSHAKAPSSAGILTSTSSSSSQSNNVTSTQIHSYKPLTSASNNTPSKQAAQGLTGGKQKHNQINSSRLNSTSNHKQLSDGLRFHNLNIDHKESGNDKCHKGNRLPLAKYKPEPWMLNDLRKESKQALHLSIIGHVDAGKSTLLGRLLYLLGRVSQRDMHKYEREAKEKGKGSFAYAWVLDESSEERARGVTMTVAVAHFETPNFRVVLLDSPGHRDFVPNMISGASQADAALLVVDASIGAFEAGMDGGGQGGGQTKEHTQLVRSFGVEQIVVAVNKMDVVNYSQRRFDDIRESLQPFLRQCGFKDSAVKWVPLSAMENQNLVASPDVDRFKSWYLGPSLLEVVDKFELPSRAIYKPLRVPIAEVMRTRTLGQATISGKLESGAIKVGTKVLVMPLGDVAIVKGIEQAGLTVTSAGAGESVDVGLQGVEQSILVPGGVLCHPDYPVLVASCLEVKVLVLEISMPILCGSQVVLHCHHAREPARITKLVSLLDQKTGSVIRRKPRCLVAHQSAVIEVVPERPICAEEYSNYRALGRISLRDAGKTLAVGIIVSITEHQ